MSNDPNPGQQPHGQLPPSQQTPYEVPPGQQPYGQLPRKSRSRTFAFVGIAVIVVAALVAATFIVRPGFLFKTNQTVTGNWSISVMLSVGGSSGPGSLDLHQDGSTVKGSLKFQSGSTFDLKGTISGQKIDLANDSGFGGISAHYELVGTVSDDFNQMSGTATLTGTETLPDGTTRPISSPPGTWSAKRV